MKIDPTKRYTMPISQGGAEGGPSSVGQAYRNVENLNITFSTTKEAVAELLPEGFSVGDVPFISYSYSANAGVDFMSGNGYKLVAIDVAAKCVINGETAAGAFNIVTYESDLLPIYGGREILGVPKIPGEITTIRVLPNGHRRWGISAHGHFLFGTDIGPLEKQTPEAIKAANEAPSGYWLNYKYIPSLDGEPDVAEPMAMQSSGQVQELALGQTGSIRFGEADERLVGPHARVVAALRDLPHLDVLTTRWSRNSQILGMDRSASIKAASTGDGPREGASKGAGA